MKLSLSTREIALLIRLIMIDEERSHGWAEISRIPGRRLDFARQATRCRNLRLKIARQRLAAKRKYK